MTLQELRDELDELLKIHPADTEVSVMGCYQSFGDVVDIFTTRKGDTWGLGDSIVLTSDVCSG